MYEPLYISLLYLLILLFYGQYFSYTTHQGGFCFYLVFKQKEGYWLSSDCIDNALSSTDLSHNRRSELRWKEVSQEVDGDCFIRNVEQTGL